MIIIHSDGSVEESTPQVATKPQTIDIDGSPMTLITVGPSDWEPSEAQLQSFVDVYLATTE